MAMIDIRDVSDEDIDVIKFYDGDYSAAIEIQNHCDGYVFINSSQEAMKGSTESCVSIESKEHAQNLIKAIEKAIELGWWK